MIGTTISHYKIVEKLGEGGMGVVYRAHDTTLDRDVALKFLPAHLSTSQQDKARFIQEAKAAATLDHPHICTIFSIDEHDNQLFIAMQLVDGQLLRDRMSGLTQKQAIDIGIQIAEGLAAAHEKGVVHRDIKPENIMIRKDGIAQVMDFGLAKLKGVSRLTKEGSTVGTAGYMSPEQVQGEDADHRSDIFSLGVLLYEMFTGQLPFRGVHETAIAYEIVNVDAVPMSAAKPDIDPALDAIVLGCLEKDPRERTQSAGQVAVELKRYRRESSRLRTSKILPSRPNVSPQATSLPSATKKGSLIHWIVSLSTLIGAAILALLLYSSGNRTESNIVRLNVSALSAPGQQIHRADVSNVALSPDGRSLVYTVAESGTTRLYLRRLDSFQAIPIKGTENGASPFFSPDGQWIGFVAEGKLMKIPVSGGTAQVLCEASGFRGAWWGADHRITFSPSYASALMSVGDEGGDVQPVSVLDSAGGERTHRWPQILPDGKWVLYTIGNTDNPNSYTDARLILQSIATGERHMLDVRGEMGRYIEPGYLLVARNGALLAAPFDLDEKRFTQQLAPVVSDLGGNPGSGVSYYSISTNGHLVYLSGSATQLLELVWVSRDGNVTPLPLPPQSFSHPRLSPDGSKLLVTIAEPPGDDSDIWIYDFRAAALRRLTFEKKTLTGIWSRDGNRLYSASSLPGKSGLMVKPADGSSSGTLLLSARGPQFPTSTTPADKQVLINGLEGTAEGDIYMVETNGGDELHKLISSPSVEYGGQISKDGRYLAYISNETGTLEVYIRTFPDLKGKWQISTDGGAYPIWSPDGREIFYLNGTEKVMSVPLHHQPTFSPGAPTELFDASRMHTPNNPIANFDISHDGQRFIFVRSTQDDAAIGSFNIILNWTITLTSAMENEE